MKNIYSFFIVFIISSSTVFSQENWLSYSVSNSGLITNHLKDIQQDSKGNIWLIGDNSIHKFFNGEIINVTEYGGDMFLLGNSSFIVDRNDGFWQSYYDNIIYTFLEDTLLDSIKWFSPSNVPNFETGQSFSALKEDFEGNIWGITRNNGLHKFDGEEWFQYSTTDISNYLYGIIEIEFDDNGDLWVITYYGLCRFNGDNWQIYDHTDIGIDGVSYAYFSDDLWITFVSDKQVVLAKYDDVDFTLYYSDSIAKYSIYPQDITSDSNGNKWIGNNLGLVRFDGDKFTLINKSNSEIYTDTVNCVLIDRYNNKWIIPGHNDSVAVQVYNEEGVSFYNSASSFITEEEINDLSIYPNPSKGPILLNLDNNIYPVKLNVKDVKGNLVKSVELLGTSDEINIEASSGVYFIEVTTVNGSSKTFKFIKN